MKKKFFGLFLIISIASFFLIGCTSTPSLYNWGNFQSQMYSNLKSGSSIESQISVMEKDLNKILSKNNLVPPGFYAHLGMLYSEAGNMLRAIECFNEEKTRFPESEVFMNRLLSQTGFAQTGFAQTGFAHNRRMI